LTVEVGDRVRRGEVLGLLGNSGNSDLPHLHFQVTDGSQFLNSDGLPYVFRSFESEGMLANPEEVLAGGVARLRSSPERAAHTAASAPVAIIDFDP
jgi:murein DD-endopeptidase MepM/ murein hydrolase activator NlpD